MIALSVLLAPQLSAFHLVGGTTAMRLGNLAGPLVAAVTVLGVGLPTLPAAADATTLYVNDDSRLCSTSGPTAGTQADPYCTIQQAADVAQPGQTVLISPGSYEENVQVTHSGSPGQPIVFTAAPGTSANGVSGVVITDDGSAHDEAQNAGFFLTGVHDVSITGLTFHDLLASAVTISTSTRVSIDQNHLDHTGTFDVGWPGVYVNGGNSAVTVSRNWFNGVGHSGIVVSPGDQGTDITENEMFQTGGPGVYVASTQGTLITNNTIGYSSGESIAVAGASTGTVIENNVTYGVAQGGDEIQLAALSAPTTTYDYNLVDASAGATAYKWGKTAYATAADLHGATGAAAHDLNTDPKLSGPDGTGAPGPGSPVIDSADANAPGLLATDILGRKPVDDPNVPNTGTGDGTRDRGAFDLQSFYPKTLALSTAQGSAPLTVTETVGLWTMWPEPLTYTVDFHDGSAPVSSSTPTIQHVYTDAGYYTPTVTVSDPSGYTRVLPAGPAGNEVHVQYGLAGFTQLAPTRVLDTRDSATGRSWNFGSHFAGYGEKVLKLGGAGAAIPRGTTAVVLNLTVVNPATEGYLAAKPDDLLPPTSSNLNFTAGQTVPNLVTAPVDQDGSVYLWTNTDNFDVVADLFGYYSPQSTGRFTAQTPVRLLDTRSDAGGLPIGPDSTVSVQVAGQHGVPTDATAAVLNLTATAPSTGGFLTAFPSGSAKPTTSNLNFLAGTTIANQVIVPIGPDGKVTIYNHTGDTHAVLDLFGYYAPDGADLYHPLDPTRLLDTRGGPGIAAGQSVSVGVSGYGGAPADAAVLNVTTTESDTPGYFTLYPHGIAVPGTSNLNFTAGETIPNQVTVPVGQNSEVDLYSFAGHSQAVVDLYGYFAKS
ncbi:hypothetical protein P3T37_006840 [Kitasatospora sp. MAA4]|uniref:right-handed parallel beta-helix repeat-containing protein n=1 Tax=Kitasatospora sp. MAA4 TaxID=3035093 RepID=UPI0024738E27|nr:right-handed parallel beta-helix repeat-containing protein [Kitasatospora sp. MAA4]MDH6137408.1 hypothetical protein [Kitasatospora sp. MAA4]